MPRHREPERVATGQEDILGLTPKSAPAGVSRAHMQPDSCSAPSGEGYVECVVSEAVRQEIRPPALPRPVSLTPDRPRGGEHHRSSQSGRGSIQPDLKRRMGGEVSTSKGGEGVLLVTFGREVLV